LSKKPDRGTGRFALLSIAASLRRDVVATEHVDVDFDGFGAGLAALALRRPSKSDQTSFQLPRVAAFEYSVARVSKKLACSTPLSSGVSQGSGCSSIM
jgi:hypothetical protein